VVLTGLGLYVAVAALERAWVGAWRGR